MYVLGVSMVYTYSIYYLPVVEVRSTYSISAVKDVIPYLLMVIHYVFPPTNILTLKVCLSSLWETGGTLQSHHNLTYCVCVGPMVQIYCRDSSVVDPFKLYQLISVQISVYLFSCINGSWHN